LWRWWLIANAPESADTDFRAPRFISDVNQDLADVFGNLVQRVTRFAQTAFYGRVPEGGEPCGTERALAGTVAERVGKIRAHHEAREFRLAAAETRALWAAANAYVQAAAPWSALRGDRPRAAVSTRTALALIEVCAAAAWSIVPSLAASAIAAVGGIMGGSAPAWPDDIESRLLSGRRLGADVGSFEPVAKIGADQLAILHHEGH
jgi:methionyl-tRNA synthetase